MFGRGNGSVGEATVPPDAGPPRPGKGRPTPKRAEAERGRRRVAAAPLDRKEAFKRNRERQREERRRMMQALKAGDDRHLPMRDRGPVRSYVRDAVDARRSVGEFFLPMALVILILTSLRNAELAALGSALWMALVVLVIVDAVALVVRLRRGLTRAYPDTSRKGAVAYGLMRSMQIRRFRLPPPKVKPGRRRRAPLGSDQVKPGGSSARSSRSSQDR